MFTCAKFRHNLLSGYRDEVQAGSALVKNINFVVGVQSLRSVTSTKPHETELTGGVGGSVAI